MKLILFLMLIFLSVTSLFSVTDKDNAQVTADRFLEYLINRKAELLYEMFNDKVKDQISVENMSNVRNQMESLLGPYLSKTPSRAELTNGSFICYSTLSFKNGNIKAGITIDDLGLVSGFNMRPERTEYLYSIPAYADTSKFAEMLIKFGQAPFILNAALTLPISKIPSPIIIMIHDTGPQDMDASIGPNKPFKDIAWGLASRGTAVFRFNKRTKQYPVEMVNMEDSTDVYDEVIDDVNYAVNFLFDNAEMYNIDKEQIYILAHGTGITFAPKIAVESGRVAGIVSLAGMARNLDVVLADQYEYLSLLDGVIDEKEQNQINEFKRRIKNLYSVNFNISTPTDSLPLNMSARYWKSFLDIKPLNDAVKFGNKMLFLQGTRDYQVTLDDYNLWKNTLNNKSNVKFVSFNDLNHYFAAGDDKSSPEEYHKPFKVDVNVIKTISEWIKE
ncbi:MAG: hypothetical protein RBT61_04645 [Candidatus Kapabacteria bacterium]|jgi:dienelactone hydrolase|nr:hypothetical protein [Candidatus Kapabacteria bacterium]